LKQMQESGVTIFFVSHDPGAVRALCSRAILLNAGESVADGKPQDVLNRYQKLIMAREQAYEEASRPNDNGDEDQAWVLEEEKFAPLHYTFRHGDGSAQVLRVELLDASSRRIEIVETGEPVVVRVWVRFNSDVEVPVCGFLVRNRHGIHLYGTNTELQKLDLGAMQAGEIVEVTFAFNCSLAPDSYSIAVAAHSPDAISFDWLDGALFFQVISADQMEGVANLNATVTTRRLNVRAREQDMMPLHA